MSMTGFRARRARCSTSELRAAGVFLLTLIYVWSSAAQAQTPFLQNGQAGFVVSNIRFALGGDSDSSSGCPHGMSLNVAEIFANTPGGKRHKGESDKDYGERLNAGEKEVSTAPNGQNMCMNPEAGQPDPNFHTVEGSDIRAEGIDLDDADSSSKPTPGGMCARQDFVGLKGEPHVANQFFRTVGCTRSYQPSGLSNSFATEMLTGAWGILIAVNGVDDIHNDDSVEVGFYANADPIQLSASRIPLAYATYAMDQDPRFRATAHGRIKNGVLTTDPVDVRFHAVTNGMRLERTLQHARLRVTVAEDGTMDGYLAGYTLADEMYDFQFAFRNGKNGAGQPAPLPLRLNSANGAARVLGYTCWGAYYALHQEADGDPDPTTGICQSVSTQYHITAIPAFLVDVATQSVNSELDRKPESHEKH